MAKVKKKEALSLEERLEQVLVPVDEQPYEVPGNWCWTLLGNISETLCDGVHYAPQYTENGYPCFSAKDIYDDKINLDKCNYVNAEEYALIRDKINIRQNSVLITKSGSIGRSAVVNNPFSFGLVESIGVINPIIINSWYIKRFLDMGFVYSTSLLEDYTTGSTIKHLTLKLLGRIPIPLAPIDEQNRIVKQIESLFAKLDEAKEKLQEVIDATTHSKQRILQEGFEGKLTKNWRMDNNVSIDAWRHTTLQEVCSQMKAGGDKPNDFVNEQDEEHRIPVVANGVTNDGIVGYTAEEKYTAGTVTVSGRGTIGFSVNRKYAFYPIVRLIVLCPKQGVINSQFLKYVFDAYPEEGTGSSIPQLTVPTIKDKNIFLPSLEEQEQIVSIIDVLFNKMDAVIEVAEKNIQKIELMKKSILAKAFRGELGTNNPDEENAIELLKSILQMEA